MKKLFAILALTTMIASPSFAVTKKKTKKKVTTTTTTTTTTPDAVRTEPVHSEPVRTTSDASFPAHTSSANHHSPEFGVDLGLGAIGSRFVFGVGFKAQWPVELDNNDFKFGAQTGFYLAPSTPTTYVIPVLATAEYDFRTNGNLKPYLGLGLGLSFTHASYSNSFYSASASSTDFAFLFTPGVNCTDSRYFFELPIGVLATSFTILPTVGMHF